MQRLHRPPGDREFCSGVPAETLRWEVCRSRMSLGPGHHAEPRRAPAWDFDALTVFVLSRKSIAGRNILASLRNFRPI
jgi:hypothetical protein